MNTPLEASDDEASVDDAIEVALNDMDGAPSLHGDPTHMDVPIQMPAEMAVAPLEEPVGSPGPPSLVTVGVPQYSGDFCCKMCAPTPSGRVWVQKASDEQRWPGPCKRTASGMVDSLVAVITHVSNRTGTQGADGVPFDT